MATREVAAATASGTFASVGPAIQLAAQALVGRAAHRGHPHRLQPAAFLIVMVITVVLVKGIRESAWVTTASMVGQASPSSCSSSSSAPST